MIQLEGPARSTLADAMRPIAYILAVLAGVPGSFVAGATVFGDGPPIVSAERIVPVVAVYLVVAAIFGFVFRLVRLASNPWRWGVTISIPAFLTVGLLGRDIGLAYQSLFIAIAVASACSGALAGALTAASFRREKR